jgi:hypothetical protein
MDDLNRRIEDDNHAFIGEEEYLEIMKRLQLNQRLLETLRKHLRHVNLPPLVRSG